MGSCKGFALLMGLSMDTLFVFFLIDFKHPEISSEFDDVKHEIKHVCQDWSQFFFVTLYVIHSQRGCVLGLRCLQNCLAKKEVSQD